MLFPHNFLCTRETSSLSLFPCRKTVFIRSGNWQRKRKCHKFDTHVLRGAIHDTVRTVHYYISVSRSQIAATDCRFRSANLRASRRIAPQSLRKDTSVREHRSAALFPSLYVRTYLCLPTELNAYTYMRIFAGKSGYLSLRKAAVAVVVLCANFKEVRVPLTDN